MVYQITTYNLKTYNGIAKNKKKQKKKGGRKGK